MKNLKWLIACLIFFYLGTTYTFQHQSEAINKQNAVTLKTEQIQQVQQDQKDQEASVITKEKTKIDSASDTWVDNTVNSDVSTKIDTSPSTINTPIEIPKTTIVENPKNNSTTSIPKENVQSDIPVTPVDTKIVANNINIDIGGICIGDAYWKVEGLYGKYYSKASLNNEKYFISGITNANVYGDNMLIVDLANDKSINRIVYLQNKVEGYTGSFVNLDTVKINDDENTLISKYGKWNDEKVEYDVKRLFYNNFTYNNKPMSMIIYVHNKTNKIYGYELSFK